MTESQAQITQSNGMVKRTTQTIKRTLKNAIKNKDIHMSLLILHTTPLKNGFLPAKGLMNSNICTNLPNIKHNKKSINSHICNQQQKSCELPTLKPNDTVCIQFYNDWKKGKVVKKLNTPRSYLVITQEG